MRKFGLLISELMSPYSHSRHAWGNGKHVPKWTAFISSLFKRTINQTRGTLLVLTTSTVSSYEVTTMAVNYVKFQINKNMQILPATNIPVGFN